MSTGIQWTEVPGWPGMAVSVTGALRGPSARVLKPYISASGHRYVLRREGRAGKQRKLFVHRAVLLAFIGPPPSGGECRHLDGNPGNNTLDNLRWGTRLDQRADDRRNGVERRPAATRLSPESVAGIRRDLAAGSGVRATARRFGVSHSTVIGVRDGRLWGAA